MESRGGKVQIGEAAPDFAATDCRGVPFRLSDLRGTKHVVLALNRGFMCPYCIRNMARLHAAREAIRSVGAEVVIVGSDGPEAFRRHWDRNGFDFTGIPDPERRILRKYGQEVKLMRLGRLPATVILDREGIVRYVHYGGSMMDIPAVDTLISEIRKLNVPG